MTWYNIKRNTEINHFAPRKCRVYKLYKQNCSTLSANNNYNIQFPQSALSKNQTRKAPSIPPFILQSKIVCYCSVTCTPQSIRSNSWRIRLSQPLWVRSETPPTALSEKSALSWTCRPSHRPELPSNTNKRQNLTVSQHLILLWWNYQMVHGSDMCEISCLWAVIILLIYQM